MNKLTRIVGPSYRPLLLTTRTLYARWQELLWCVRVPERRNVFIVLPPGSDKVRATLLAIGKNYETRGGAVRIIEASQEMERYYEARQRLSESLR
jgi:hypothetical protein